MSGSSIFTPAEEQGQEEEKSIAEVKNGSKPQRNDERGDPTLMVVSSEEVISVWPSWLHWHQKTVLVCPSKVANTFPVGSSSTWRGGTNTGVKGNTNANANLCLHMSVMLIAQKQAAGRT